MFLALEEAPFVLQGPKPPIPESAMETTWLLAAGALTLVALAGFALRRHLRAGPRATAPLTQLELALTRAETQPVPAAIAQATEAFRAYLAAVEPRAAVSLSTEELVALLSGLPMFLPARQPLVSALRGADAAKFAGAALEVPLLLAGLREAAKRVEEARRAFARRVVAPLLPPRPVAAETPPPLPGPPPLPRRDHA